MEKRRTPHEAKEVGVKALKDSYEKINRKACPPEKVREFERLHERELLPKVFDKKR